MADGLTRHQVETRVETGRWVRTAFRGVYRDATHPQTWRHRAMAAVLAMPDGAVASHTTAAALFGLLPAPKVPHVTVPPERGSRQRGLVLHRSPLGAFDRCEAQQIPPSGPARTLVDCAQILGGPELMTVLDSCLCRRLSTPAKVLAAAERVSVAAGGPGGVDRRHPAR